MLEERRDLRGCRLGILADPAEKRAFRRQCLGQRVQAAGDILKRRRGAFDLRARHFAREAGERALELLEQGVTATEMIADLGKTILDAGRHLLDGGNCRSNHVGLDVGRDHCIIPSAQVVRPGARA